MFLFVRLSYHLAVRLVFNSLQAKVCFHGSIVFELAKKGEKITEALLNKETQRSFVITTKTQMMVHNENGDIQRRWTAGTTIVSFLYFG